MLFSSGADAGWIAGNGLKSWITQLGSNNTGPTESIALVEGIFSLMERKL